MKKFIKFTLACLLTLGFVAAQSNTAQAAKKSKPYNDYKGHLINGYWDTRASINLKLRHNYWFHSKWQHEMKFRIGGDGAVKMDEDYGNYDPNAFPQMSGAWDFDDDYDITVRDNYGSMRVSRRLKGGTDVAVEMKRLKKDFNNTDVEVGWTFEIASYWNDTITPNNGASKNLYLGKEGKRTSYNFTFTDEGLVEEATNLDGYDNIYTDMLFPIKEEKGNFTWSGLQMRINHSGNASFHAYPENPNLKSRTEIGVWATDHGNADRLGRAGRLHFNVTASQQFSTIQDRLNKMKLGYGDYLYFAFDKLNVYQPVSKLGKNTKKGNFGLFDLTNTTGKIKITRYGFLTENGYKVNYKDHV